MNVPAVPLGATASEVAALVAAVAAAVLVVGVLVMLLSVNATLRALRETTENLRRTTAPLLGEVRDAVTHANGELERVDALVVTAESISSTVDSASKLAYLAFSNPVIKVLAFTAGTGRAMRRFRRKGER
jgi:hypothetical protein